MSACADFSSARTAFTCSTLAVVTVSVAALFAFKLSAGISRSGMNPSPSSMPVTVRELMFTNLSGVPASEVNIPNDIKLSPLIFSFVLSYPKVVICPSGPTNLISACTPVSVSAVVIQIFVSCLYHHQTEVLSATGPPLALSLISVFVTAPSLQSYIKQPSPPICKAR